MLVAGVALFQTCVKSVELMVVAVVKFCTLFASLKAFEDAGRYNSKTKLFVDVLAMFPISQRGPNAIGVVLLERAVNPGEAEL